MQRAEQGGALEPSVWDAAIVVPECLFVGSLRAALDRTHLDEYRITHILTVANRLQVIPPEYISHKCYEIADHPSANIFAELEDALAYIDSAVIRESQDGKKGSILVHCASGISRSVSVCCAWLMTRRGLTLEAALSQIRSTRPLAAPNIGFKAQLMCLEETGGDISKAFELFESRVGCRMVTDIIREQREAANRFHEIADVMENTIQSALAQQDADIEELNSLRTTWIAELEKCQNQINAYIVDNAYLQDAPAAMIRRSAFQKVSRLLEHQQQCSTASTTLLYTAP